jgi:hypothetical protein
MKNPINSKRKNGEVNKMKNQDFQLIVAVSHLDKPCVTILITESTKFTIFATTNPTCSCK